MENQKTKPPKLTGKEALKWIADVYTPWYDKRMSAQTADDGNPDTPPPPPPGHGKG